MSEEKSGIGCGKIFGAGCGCLVVVLMLLAVVVVFSLGRIRSTVDSAKETFQETMQLRAAVQSEFDVESVRINLDYKSGQEGATLGLELVNPPFLELEDVDLEAKALEIATFAKGQLPSPESWSMIEIQLTRQGSSGIPFSTKSRYAFPMDELPASADSDADTDIEAEQPGFPDD